MYAASVSGLSADEVRCRLAEIKVERARLDAEEASLVALPEFGSALTSGSIVAGHVDVLADTVKKVSEVDRDRVLAEADALLRSARRLSVDQFAKHVRSEVTRLSADKGLGVFERQRRATYLKVWNDIDGMIHLRGAFDPERGSVLLSRLEQRVEAMFHSGDREVPVEVGPGVEPNDHRRALALTALLPRLRGVGRRAALVSRQHGAEVFSTRRACGWAPRNCLDPRHPPSDW